MQVQGREPNRLSRVARVEFSNRPHEILSNEDTACRSSCPFPKGSPADSGVLITRSRCTLVQSWARTAMPGEAWMVTSVSTTSELSRTTIVSSCGVESVGNSAQHRSRNRRFSDSFAFDSRPFGTSLAKRGGMAASG